MTGLPHLRFALFGNTFQDGCPAAMAELASLLGARGASLVVEESFHDHLVVSGAIPSGGLETFRDSGFEADFVVTLGGDGTLLRAASHVGSKGTPILGVNMGRLGFLADIAPDGLGEAIDEIYRGEYALDSLAVIHAESDGGPFSGHAWALNDIAVLKRDDAAMITIHASVDGEELVTYQADGLIVSTPTGSTAYSLSNGGPVMAPTTGILCLTPVAPHSLSIRPIVIPDGSVVSLTVESRSHNFLIAFDGRAERREDRAAITISRAPHDIRIVKRQGKSYYATLRQKMMWGADKRAEGKR